MAFPSDQQFDHDRPQHHPQEPSERLVHAGVSGRVVSSSDLFGADVVVTIEHQGALYQLRTTRQGKLILTK